MGMLAGSLSLLKGNYHRPLLLLALLPSSAATPQHQQQYIGRGGGYIKASASAPSSFSISTRPKYGIGFGASNRKVTTLLFGFDWECCFCTAASSFSSFPSPSPSSTTVLNSDDSSFANSADKELEDEMTKIKETANTLDIRVGKILKAWTHPEADSLYVEEVDVGEPQPRIICSGLVKYVPLHRLQDINVVVLANLKPRNMRGVKSSGMLMAASDASHENVELLVPPEGSVPGQRIWFGSADEKESLPDAASPNQIQKKKIWELIQPHLRTDDSCIAALGVHTMRATEGVVASRSLKNARIS